MEKCHDINAGGIRIVENSLPKFWKRREESDEKVVGRSEKFGFIAGERRRRRTVFGANAR